MLSEIFKKKKITSRTIGDDRQSVGILFRTYLGGTTTCDYQSEDDVRLINRQLREQISQLIQKGNIDEYTSPALFDGLVRAKFALCHNAVEKTGIHHEQVIKSILSVQQSEMLLNMREYETAEAVLDESAEAKSVRHNKEVGRYENDHKKIVER